MNDQFRKKLALVIGRKPTEPEVKEALERITRINRLLADIRSGRSGMSMKRKLPKIMKTS